ncbi:MAG: hypothetical protein J7L14_01720, partial [Candidatus Diapherotrites archaeon]|nr:hypothetical protein [Candidatus Diapherotrites archaeon]
IMSFGGGGVIIGVDIRPTLTLSNPADTTVKRKTSALFVLNVDNSTSASGSILIDRFEVPLIAGKHYLAIVGAEITGLRNIEVVYQV